LDFGHLANLEFASSSFHLSDVVSISAVTWPLSVIFEPSARIEPSFHSPVGLVKRGRQGGQGQGGWDFHGATFFHPGKARQTNRTRILCLRSACILHAVGQRTFCPANLGQNVPMPTADKMSALRNQESAVSRIEDADLPNKASRAILLPMQPVTERLRNFLQYVAVKLIDDPSQAQLKVAELAPKKVRFKLVLAKADVAMLIGRNGFTASAIRNVLKAAADKEGVQFSLQIHSHEEEAEMMARGEGH
jgi:predicted RNA-binding protein YlqC (UPF0109 family)